MALGPSPGASSCLCNPRGQLLLQPNDAPRTPIPSRIYGALFAFDTPRRRRAAARHVRRPARHRPPRQSLGHRRARPAVHRRGGAAGRHVQLAQVHHLSGGRMEAARKENRGGELAPGRIWGSSHTPGNSLAPVPVVCARRGTNARLLHVGRVVQRRGGGEAR
eukprot:scaffold1278_cov79-Isochrysis_galbana.AAC.1